MSFDSDLESCLLALHQGEIVFFPSDEGWVLGADATNETAVANLISIDPSYKEQPLIVLLADERELIKYVSALDLSVFNYLDSIEQPTAIVYEGVVGLCDLVLNNYGAAAIQLIQSDFCRHLIKRFRKPLASLYPQNGRIFLSPESVTNNSTVLNAPVGYVVQYLLYDNSNDKPISIIQWDKISSQI